jgi:hypothetical protein
LDVVLISTIGMGCLALIPGWLMCQKAFYTSRRWWAIGTVLMSLILPCLLAPIAFALPFLISWGKQVGPYDTLVDMLLYGASGLGLIALAGYVADHIDEKPVRALLSGTACLAIVLLPILYYFFADWMHSQLDIVYETSPKNR